MTVFGGRTLKEIIKEKQGHRIGPDDLRVYKKGLGHGHTEGRPGEDPGRKWPSPSQGESYQEKLTLLMP